MIRFLREDDKAVALGGLAAGVERRLPAEGNQRLVDANIHGKRVVLLVEGPYSRTTQWTPTLNFRTPTNDDRAGHVQHGSIDPKSVIEPPRFEHQSLDTYLANNRAELVRQLNQGTSRRRGSCRTTGTRKNLVAAGVRGCRLLPILGDQNGNPINPVTLLGDMMCAKVGDRTPVRSNLRSGACP